MKRWFSIFFLSLLTFNFAGTYIYFLARVVQIRQHMQERLRTLPEEQLARLVLTREEYALSRVDDHEIKVDGKMYDVARILFDGTTVIVVCLHDESEDNLLSLLDAVVSSAHQDNHPIPNSILQFLSLTFLIEEFSFTPPDRNPQRIVSNEHESLSAPYLRIVSPPPRG